MLELTLFKRALQCCNVVNISFQSRRFSHVVYDEALERSSRLPIYFISLFISSLLIFFFPSSFCWLLHLTLLHNGRRRDPTFISIVYAVSPSLNSLTEERRIIWLLAGPTLDVNSWWSRLLTCPRKWGISFLHSIVCCTRLLQVESRGLRWGEKRKE